MNWDRSYDRFLNASAWVNALFYTWPAAVILGACWYFQVAERFWTPLLLLYFIGTVAHILGHGLMAINVQIKTSTDYASAEFIKALLSSRQISS